MGLKKYVCLDVGERRIGVAVGDSSLRLAWPLSTVIVDGSEQDTIMDILESQQATDIVVGRPRNQSGEDTAQTKYVQDFAVKVLEPSKLSIHWQDESLTSVIAEDQLRASRKPYTKEQIDAQAATIILQDFLETL